MCNHENIVPPPSPSSPTVITTMANSCTWAHAWLLHIPGTMNQRVLNNQQAKQGAQDEWP